LEGKAIDGIEVFKQVKTIWGYFYYKQSADNMFPDGVIEEWTFSTQEAAKTAAEIFQKIGDDVFFNTEPYPCVVGNKLYLFHTRAMAFSFDQKPLFLEFVKRNHASI
jgi:hypothetical protein